MDKIPNTQTIANNIIQPKMPSLNGKLGKLGKLGKIDGFSSNDISISKPPTKLYEAAATLALLTGAAIEGAGLALKEAIKKQNLNPNEARRIVGNLAKNEASGVLQQGGQVGNMSKNSALSLNLPPGVELATDTIIDIAEKTKTVVGDGIEIAAKRTYEVGSKLLDDAVNAVVPVELLNKPYGELNPTLTAKLRAIANNLEAISRDPEARTAIGNLTKATTDIGIDAVNAAMPNIDRLVDRIWIVANNVGAKSVRSAVNVGMSMLVTALSSVPVVGGIVVGSLQAGTIFNNMVETGSKAVQGFSQIAKDSIDTMSTITSTVNESKNKLITPIEQVKNVYGKYSGGSGHISRSNNKAHKTRRKQTSNQRIKIEKRLRKSLKAFFG